MRFVLLGILLLPQVVAAVSISEIAWMGTAVSANDEWLELHNDSAEAVTVTDWSITDGNNLHIILSGTIPAHSYVVLERTDDTSAPGAAFLTYPGVLVNTGATLQLQRADGSLVDQVVGGEDWELIGGDNSTKETAQYTTSGWITAAPTPGEAAPTAPPPQTEESEQTVENKNDSRASSQTATTKTSGSSGEPVYLTLPGVTLVLTLTAPTRGYVHQPIDFRVTPSGIGEHLSASLSYVWNFGDGTTATGQNPQHHFSYPGTYVVTVYANYKRQEQVARHEITILPVRLSLTTNQSGDVQVNNDAPYEVDLSGYQLAGEGAFTFPPRTILLANQTITIPLSTVGETKNRMLALYDTASSLVASRLPESYQRANQTEQLAAATASEYRPRVTSTHEPTTESVTAARATAASAAKPESTFGFADTAPPASSSTIETTTVQPTTTATITAPSGTASSDPAFSWTYLGLAGVLVAGVAGVLVAPRRNQQS